MSNKVLIPLSIVIAAALISLSIYYSKNAPAQPQTQEKKDVAELVQINPVTEKDHIQGNPDAKVMIIEYSDFECPFCQRHHNTMKDLMAVYGVDGEVAWVYRHFPLDQIHENARPAAEASECVAQIAGNDAFWKYSDELFNGSPDSLTKDSLEKIALDLGVDEEGYKKCVNEKLTASIVQSQYEDGMKIANLDPNFGTPYSILINKKGNKVSIVGAQPYTLIEQAIKTLLLSN